MRWILILYWAFSTLLFADEIPEIVKQDIKTLEWNWTYYSKEISKPVGYMADFTKQEKMGDGTIYLPWIGWDFKNSKFTTTVFWARINCEKNTADSPGFFDKGLFSLQNPTVYGENSIGAVPKHMICGVTTQNGDKVFGLSANVSESSIVWWGWIPDKIKKEDVQDSMVKFTLYQYDIVSRQLGFNYAYTADCSNKKIIIHSQDVAPLDLNLRKNAAWLYTYNSVCSIRDKFKTQPSADPPKVEQKVISDPPITNKKITVEEAKTKCADLGFKPKTEKFGSCVLELMK